MSTAWVSFLVAAGAVTLAEMGDKTQLLAMAFATKYKASKVMIGVFVATVLNHAAAVALGSFVARSEVLNLWIQVIASLSFIFFGLWTIRGDKLEGEQDRKTRFGAVVTVAIAFFIAELGDKTQLATIALAAKYPTTPVFVLMGTTTGMLIADGLGILVGVVLCRRIPERTLKLVSAAAFIVFGLVGSWQVLMERLRVGLPSTISIVAGLAVLSGIAAWLIARRSRPAESGDDPVAEYCRVKTDKE